MAAYSTVTFLTDHVWTWTDVHFDPVPFLHLVVLDLTNMIPDIRHVTQSMMVIDNATGFYAGLRGHSPFLSFDCY